MKNTPPSDTSMPRVEVLKDEDGQVETILVHLRDPSVKAVRAVQPNQSVMVDVGLDSGDRPVFVCFQEPLAGWKGPRHTRRTK